LDKKFYFLRGKSDFWNKIEKSEHLAAMRLQTTLLSCRPCLLAAITAKVKPQLLFKEQQNKVKSAPT